MKFLFCCEFYYPSVGGVQEVMKQIAERLVARGHEVTVATTTLSNRHFKEINGVQIAQFAVSGNLVRGMHGEIDRYRQFVKTFECDAILIKAAQQWTFDALWPDLEEISARKVFIPCGFSGLYESRYQAYFKYLPEVLRQFDALIFYAEDYRDINYAREHEIPNCVVLSNGASEKEFNVPADPTFRSRHNIPEDSFLILTVGSLTGAKGHLELAQAVSLMPENGKHITLLLNGNNPFPEDKPEPSRIKVQAKPQRIRYRLISAAVNNIFNPINGLREMRAILSAPNSGHQDIFISPFDRVRQCIAKIPPSNLRKRVLLLDLSRADLVQAYLAADLFVFASHVEYSPLVLFEAAAAGTPFITSNAGNAKEIIKWLGGGFMMQDSANSEGFRVINPQSLADEIASLINQPIMLKKVGGILKESWKIDFTWDEIARKYESILMGPKGN